LRGAAFSRWINRVYSPRGIAPMGYQPSEQERRQLEGFARFMLAGVAAFFFTLMGTIEEFDYWMKGTTVEATITEVALYRSNRNEFGGRQGAGYEVQYTYMFEDRQWRGSFQVHPDQVAAFRSIKSFPLEVMKGRKIPQSRIKGTHNTLSVLVFAASLLLIGGFLIKVQFFPSKK
jgi:hypothetical protein